MTYFAGIDAGQSSTTAVIGDANGKELARGHAGPADEVGQGPESARLRDALRGALDDALKNAHLSPETRFESIVAGISGYEGTVYGAPVELPAAHVQLMHDARIAHAGALGGESGVVVIAGTGAVAYAVSENGTTATTGGWGYLFGDEGSAFSLAREVLSEAMRDCDGGDGTDLAPVALTHFGKPSLRALARSVYAGEISRADLAAFAPVVIEQAERGNERAAQHVRDAAGALVLLAKHAMDRAGIDRGDIAFTGGLLRSSCLSDQVDQWMRDLLPNGQRVPPRADAAAGALLLAYRA